MKHMFLFVAAWLLFVQAMAVSYSGSFGMSDLQFSTGERGYDTVMMNGLKNIGVIGAPQLPVKHLNFIIPPGMDVDNISIVSNTQTLSNTYNIIPVQPQIPTSDEWQQGTFVEPDSIYYSLPIYPLTTAEIVSYGYFDGNARIATIAVYPLQYLPQSKQLVLNSSISFSLTFKASTQTPVYPAKRSGFLQEKYNSLLSSIIENPGDVQMYYSQPPSIGLLPAEADYVIVAPAELMPFFSDLVSWKTAKGLHAYTKSIEDIIAQYPNGDQVVPGGLGINDDAGSIRQYLFEQYSQHGLVYALIVGDNTNSPVRYGVAGNYYPGALVSIVNKIPADLYFSDFSGNWNVDGDEHYGETIYSPDTAGEIFVGRLLVPSLLQNGEEHINNWIEKLITYESNPGYGDDTYLTNVVYAIADEAVYNGYYPSDQISILNGHGFQVTSMVESPQCGPLGTPTGAAVVTQINNGTGILSFYAHGDVSCVAVSTTNINAYPKHYIRSLDNMEIDHQYGINEVGNGIDCFPQNGKYSINYSISCDVAAYDRETEPGEGICMAKAHTSHTNAMGGPAFLSNTRSGWFGTSRYLHSAFLRILLQVQSACGQYNCTNVGVAEVGSKILSPNSYVSYSHNLFGDPEMPIWTEQPRKFVMSYNTQNNSIHVVNAETNIVTPNAMVHFWNANNSQSERRMTDSNGNAFCSFP